AKANWCETSPVLFVPPRTGKKVRKKNKEGKKQGLTGRRLKPQVAEKRAVSPSSPVSGDPQLADVPAISRRAPQREQPRPTPRVCLPGRFATQTSLLRPRH